jgi:hypothetical protein
MCIHNSFHGNSVPFLPRCIDRRCRPYNVAVGLGMISHGEIKLMHARLKYLLNIIYKTHKYCALEEFLRTKF